MKYFSVLLFKDAFNPTNIPINWPAEIVEINEDVIVEYPKIKMSEIELNTHISNYEAEKELWNLENCSKYKKDIPQEVPLWAFRSILTIMGIAPQVDVLINSLPEPQKTVASVQWQYGNFIERNHPLIDSLGTNLGLTKEQINNVFIEAFKLK